VGPHHAHGDYYSPAYGYRYGYAEGFEPKADQS
jgi:hypothetical protein